MRILHLTDFHFHKPWFDWAAQAARDFDLVALTGDLLRCDASLPFDRQVAWVRAWIDAFPGRLAICSGNHDEPAGWLNGAARPAVTVDGGQMALGGWGFESVGWGHLPTAGGARQVALVHCPPEGTATAKSRKDGADWGDFELGELLRRGPVANRPRLILSGHLHAPLSWRHRVNGSWLLNPGVAAGGRVPRRIIIDLARQTAERKGPDVGAQHLTMSSVTKWWR